jgi:hypothetical protein
MGSFYCHDFPLSLLLRESLHVRARFSTTSEYSSDVCDNWLVSGITVLDSSAPTSSNLISSRFFSYSLLPVFLASRRRIIPTPRLLGLDTTGLSLLGIVEALDLAWADPDYPL